MIVACLALTIALTGAGYAAVTLPRNSVGTAQLKRHAVTAKKIKAGNVTRGKIAANAVNGVKVKDGTIGFGYLTPGAAGADAYARVQPNGVLLPLMPADNPNFPPTNYRITQDNIVKPAATTGIYCIVGLPFRVASAMVASDNAGASAAAQNNVIVSVAVERGNGLGGCVTTPATQLRVVATQVTDAAAPANVDKGFILWLEQ
jgi:hypothetical protein